MKKNLQVILVMAALFLSSMTITKAQNPVPNASFENWTGGEPDGWMTSNQPGFITNVTQTSDYHTGASAAYGEVQTVTTVNFPPLLSTQDNQQHGFPVSQMYGTLGFYYKFTQGTPTTFLLATVTINDASGNQIGYGAVPIPAPASSYTYMYTPVTYTGTGPSEAIIAFTIFDQAGLAPPGNSFEIDDVSLSGSAGIAENTSFTAGIEKVQPNPVHDIATVNYALLKDGKIQFELRDATGKKYNEWTFANETAGRHKVDLNVDKVPAGYYLMRMITDEESYVSPVVVR